MTAPDLARILAGVAGLAIVVITFLLTDGILVPVIVVVVITVIAYVVGATAVARRTADVSTPEVQVRSVAFSPTGLMAGVSAGVNLGLWSLLPWGWVVGVPVGALGFASVLPMSRRAGFQKFLGWGSLLMPFSYLATAPGVLLFLINLPFSLSRFGRRALRLDTGTGTVETTGGIVGITGFRGGFNLGNFVFLCPSPERGLDIQSPFRAPGLSAHETGHTLNVAAFGGVFHWVNAVDENIPPLKRKGKAFGEMLAEGHLPRRLPRRHLRVWS